MIIFSCALLLTYGLIYEVRNIGQVIVNICGELGYDITASVVERLSDVTRQKEGEKNNNTHYLFLFDNFDSNLSHPQERDYIFDIIVNQPKRNRKGKIFLCF